MVFPNSNSLKSIYQTMLHEVEAIYGRDEVRSMWFMLLEAYLGWSLVEALQKEEETVTESEMLKLHFAIKELKLKKPIQYILGYAWFCDLKLKVGPEVLIPRQETEELVAWIIHDMEDRAESVNLRILDIGTGSGCIALALAANLQDASVTALDVSEEALNLAKENALQNGLKVAFISGDLLDEKFSTVDTFDVIVSNPPYVRESEKVQMAENVLNYEPQLALFVKDEDPLIFYRNILHYAKTAIKPGGAVYFEINEAMGKELQKLSNSLGFSEVELREDMNGKERMLRVMC